MTGSGSVTVGIIHFNDYDSLPECLEALTRQTLALPNVILVDNTLSAERRFISSDPRLNLSIIVNDINNGYAGAANQIIGLSKTPFVFLINPDVRLNPRCLEILLGEAFVDNRFGILGPKLFREPGWMDSAGHDFVRSRRFRDRGMGERDENQYPGGDVFGICGAAILLRREMLEDVKLQGEYFDEDFFVYHEDTDLCWRAWHQGWRVRYVPEAVATHLRGWRQDNRHKMSPRVRIESFKNRYLEMIKNETLESFVYDLPFIVAQEILRFILAAFKEPSLFKAYWKVVRVMPRMLRKRQEIMRRRKPRAFREMISKRK